MASMLESNNSKYQASKISTYEEGIGANHPMTPLSLPGMNFNYAAMNQKHHHQ